MSRRRFASFVDLFLATPAKSALLSVCPLALALAQLLNSYANGFSPTVAVAFAAAMVAFAVVATGHHAAEYRLRRLEGSSRPPN